MIDNMVSQLINIIHFFGGMTLIDYAIFLAVWYFMVWPALRFLGDLAFCLGRFCALLPIRTAIRHADIQYNFAISYQGWE